MEAPEIESEDAVSQSTADKQLTKSATEVSALCLHGNGNACLSVASLDPILVHLIELWPFLSTDARETIRAICLDAMLLGDK
jgi:hypothetical protein